MYTIVYGSFGGCCLSNKKGASEMGKKLISSTEGRIEREKYLMDFGKRSVRVKY